MSLLSLRNAVINEASIDGKTGSNARHSTPALNELINRHASRCRSLVAAAGSPWFQVLDAITPIPGATANEDFIEVPFPAPALEIIGVDVRVGGNPKWVELDPADWTQRRLLNFNVSTPEGGVGWWATEIMPEADDASSVTAGKIALFPNSLAGSYRITYLKQFVPMTQDTSLFVGTTDMFTWVIKSCVLVAIGRDANKKATAALALKQLEQAEANIVKASKRVQRAGAVTPKRIGGERF
jgi:hypothetical protein